MRKNGNECKTVMYRKELVISIIRYINEARIYMSSSMYVAGQVISYSLVHPQIPISFFFIIMLRAKHLMVYIFICLVFDSMWPCTIEITSHMFCYVNFSPMCCYMIIPCFFLRLKIQKLLLYLEHTINWVMDDSLR